MNSIMTCILPLFFSVPLVVLLVGGMTVLATRLEGAKNNDTLYGTTADGMIRSASEDARVHGYRKKQEASHLARRGLSAAALPVKSAKPSQAMARARTISRPGTGRPSSTAPTMRSMAAQRG